MELELTHSGPERLKVVAPWWPPVAPWPIGFEGVSALETYYEHLEVDDEPTAVHKTSEDIHRTAESVRAVIRQAEEGVSTASWTQPHHATRRGLLEVDAAKLRRLRRERALYKPSAVTFQLQRPLRPGTPQRGLLVLDCSQPGSSVRRPRIVRLAGSSVLL